MHLVVTSISALLKPSQVCGGFSINFALELLLHSFLPWKLILFWCTLEQTLMDAYQFKSYFLEIKDNPLICATFAEMKSSKALSSGTVSSFHTLNLELWFNFYHGMVEFRLCVNFDFVTRLYHQQNLSVEGRISNERIQFYA